jgi:hypothetical protein
MAVDEPETIETKGGSSSTALSNDQIQQILSRLNGGKRKVPHLTEILKISKLTEVLNDNQALEALYPLLPPGAPATKEEISETINSSQFRQVHNFNSS